MRLLRSVVELSLEPWCVLNGHDWVTLKKGDTEYLYCQRCGKRSDA